METETTKTVTALDKSFFTNKALIIGGAVTGIAIAGGLLFSKFKANADEDWPELDEDTDASVDEGIES